MIRHVTHRDQTLSISVNERITSDRLMVCLHGLGCGKESFDILFSAPELESYSICAVDLPGHGESDRPDDFTYGMDEYAKVVSLLIEQIAPHQVSVVAHSMGGAVGLLLTNHGVDIETFVNIEGNLVAEDCGFASRGIASQSFEQFVDNGFAEFLRSLKSSERADLQAWSNWFRQASPKAIHEGARSLVEWSDSGQLLEMFNALPNTSYIHGDEDAKDFLLPHLRRVPVTTIPKAGHFCMIDSPEKFRDAVVDGVL